MSTNTLVAVYTHAAASTSSILSASYTNNSSSQLQKLDKGKGQAINKDKLIDSGNNGNDESEGTVSGSWRLDGRLKPACK